MFVAKTVVAVISNRAALSGAPSTLCASPNVRMTSRTAAAVLAPIRKPNNARITGRAPRGNRTRLRGDGEHAEESDHLDDRNGEDRTDAVVRRNRHLWNDRDGGCDQRPCVALGRGRGGGRWQLPVRRAVGRSGR